MVNAAPLKHSDFRDAVTVWKECLKTIKENVTLMTYNTWFLPIKPLELNENTLKVQIPSRFFWEWIEEHYNTLINKTIVEIIGPQARLSYLIAEEKEKKEHSGPNFNREKPVIKLVPDISVKKPGHETHLNPRYTFDNFIKGEGNQLARAAAGAITSDTGGYFVVSMR